MTELNEKDIRKLIRDELSDLILASKYTFQKMIQIFDNKNIQLGRTNGTMLGTNTDQKLGFFGSTPVIKQTALTAQLTSITHTAPGTPDYAIQDFVDVAGDGSQGFSFKNKDEANTVLSVVLNLQTRLSELETKLKALGLIA